MNSALQVAASLGLFGGAVPSTTPPRAIGHAAHHLARHGGVDSRHRRQRNQRRRHTFRAGHSAASSASAVVCTTGQQRGQPPPAGSRSTRQWWRPSGSFSTVPAASPALVSGCSICVLSGSARIGPWRLQPSTRLGDALLRWRRSGVHVVGHDPAVVAAPPEPQSRYQSPLR